MDNTTLPQSSHTPDEGEKPRQFIRIGNVKIDLGDGLCKVLTVPISWRRNSVSKNYMPFSLARKRPGT